MKLLLELRFTDIIEEHDKLKMDYSAVNLVHEKSYKK